MESSEEEEEEEEDQLSSNFCHWNNWRPINKTTKGRNIAIKTSFARANKKLNNWSIPHDFGLKSLKNVKTNQCDQTQGKQLLTSIHTDKLNCTTKLRDNNDDWGSRFSRLTSYGEVEENTCIWDYYGAGIFGYIKLAFNSYGNLQVFAHGEVNNEHDQLKAYVVTNSEEHVRQLLRVPTDEWIVLVETVKQTKEKLIFDASIKCVFHNLSPVAKLWQGLCMRRHYLPLVAIKLRRTGVQKMTQMLKIMPKFTVQLIRTHSGLEID